MNTLLAVILLAPSAKVVARPVLHGNNVDELVCLVLPMLILGMVFLVAMRKGNADDLEDEAETADVTEDGAPATEKGERTREAGQEQRS
jgi:hypothetical protein